ncbi:MAG: preprotein translocase subunit SecG [Candidatus Eisenbacteria sp.]|nr:preprotein translocase subunit SecG [Candidatus Eisenbacteria bacterium]
MFTLLLVLHILIAVVLVMSILMQSGQAGGLSGSFGGGGGGAGQSLFGGKGAATFLSKATAYLGAAFLAISLLLAYVQANRGGGVASGRNILRETLPTAPQSAPYQASPAEMPGEQVPISEEGGLSLPTEEPADGSGLRGEGGAGSSPAPSTGEPAEGSNTEP